MKKLVKSGLCTLLAMLTTFVFGQQANELMKKADRGFFIENKGQWHSDVLYLYRMGGLDAWIYYITAGAFHQTCDFNFDNQVPII